MTVPDFPDEKAPDAHATAISLTGAPLLGFKNILGSNAAGQAIGSGAQVTLLSAVPVNQIGYEMLFTFSTAAATASGAFIFVSWSDSVTSLVTDSQTWSFFAGSNAAPHSIRLVGPSNGDRVTVIAGSKANAQTVKYSIMQTSRVYTRHLGHTLTPQGVAPSYPGFTAANADPSSNILCAESQSVGASGNTVLLLPLYCGTARFWARASDGTGLNNEWRLLYNSALITLNDTIPYQIEGNQGFSPAGQGSAEIDNVAMPRTQLSLQLVNHNTTTANTMEAHLIAREMQA